MCHSVHGGVGFPACITGHMTGGLHPGRPRRVCRKGLYGGEGLHPEEGLHPGGSASKGVCIQGSQHPGGSASGGGQTCSFISPELKHFDNLW